MKRTLAILVVLAVAVGFTLLLVDHSGGNLPEAAEPLAAEAAAVQDEASPPELSPPTAREPTAQDPIAAGRWLPAPPSCFGVQGLVSVRSEGKPIRGARVTLWEHVLGRVDDITAPAAQNRREYRHVDTTFTDREGIFLFSGLASMTGFIGVEAAGRATHWTEPIDISTVGEDRFLEIHLGQGGWLAGTLTDVDGEPVTDLSVIAVRPDDGHHGVRVDGEGRFRLGPLEPGQYRIVPNRICPQTFRGRDAIVPRWEDLPPEPVRVLEGLTTKVQLDLGAAGFGLLKGAVHLYGIRPEHLRVGLTSDRRRVEPGPDGNFRFNRLKPRQYEVFLYSDGVRLIGEDVVVAAGETSRVDFHLTLIPIRGIVRDATTNRPLPRAVVTTCRVVEDERGNRSVADLSYRRTREDGTFDFDIVPTDIRYLRVRSRPNGPEVEQFFRMHGSTPHLELRVQPTGSLLIELENRPIGCVYVAYLSNDQVAPVDRVVESRNREPLIAPALLPATYAVRLVEQSKTDEPRDLGNIGTVTIRPGERSTLRFRLPDR